MEIRFGHVDFFTYLCRLIMKRLRYLILLLILVIVPAMASAQVKKPTNKNKKPKTTVTAKERKPIQPDNLELSDPNDAEYKGVLKGPDKNVPKDHIDESELDVELDQPQQPYTRPFIINPEEETDEESDEVQLNPYQSSADDEGAESEEEILYVGDSTLVHNPKADLSDLTEPIIIQLTNPENGEMFVFPTPEIARATSHFGPRRRRFHYGVDLAMPKGEPVYAAFDGVVRFSKYNRSYGNLIVIHHNNGLETYYAHLSKRHVTPGTQVRAGDIIGLCGNTGRSYGSHLHFEIRYEGNAMNPEDVIDCATRTLLSPTLSLTKDSFRKMAKKGYENRKKGKGTSTKSTSNYSSDGKYYKVRSGDTLSRIAQRNGTTVAKLCKLNNLKETSILQIGQRIRLR